ncbi:MAG: DUF1566 domain-containing protein [Beijerinckiaceae bacterium]
MNRFRRILAQAIHPSLVFLAALMLFAHGASAACSDPRRFVLDDDEARDTKTGLVWKRCSLGLVWLDRDGCRGEIAQAKLEAARAAAAKEGGGWRLPSADELLTLVMRGCGEPAIEAAAFPDVPLDVGGEGSLYWTSTPAGMLGMTITIDFRDGTYDMHSPGLGYYVRLVKGEARP